MSLAPALPHASPFQTSSDHDRFALLERELERERRAVLDHPVYERVRDRASLRSFMACHVFAVWDFMSLLKALQQRVTCTDVPWLPPASPELARLINEIVLSEETDEVLPGSYMSHFELYLAAMAEVGADARPIAAFITRLGAGCSLERALEEAPIAPPTRRFVLNTLTTAREGRIHEIAAAFLLGREDLVPAMFRRLLASLEADLGRACPSFRLYLERHVALDEQEHGPRARRLLQGLCADSASTWEQAKTAAQGALRARRRLWDGAVREIEAGAPDSAPIA